MFAGAEHVRRHADGVAAGLQRLDRRAGGDAAHDRHGDRALAIVSPNRRGRRTLPSVPSMTLGVKPRRLLAPADQLRQLDHLDGAGAVGQAADEAALFQGRDQAVDAGFRAQIERVLHLVEGGRNAGFLQALADESQQFDIVCA